MSATAYDGPFLSPEPFEVGAPELEYPFLHLGDNETYMRRRLYKQHPDYWRPGVMGTPDPKDPATYLVQESPPVRTASGLYRWTRTYSRIPGPQEQPATLIVVKPSPNLDAYPGIFGNYIITQPDTSLQRFDIYESKNVSSDSGLPGLPTGGTYQLTFSGNTTSNIAYNANAAAVQSALNALPRVQAFGNTSVTGDYGNGLNVAFGAAPLISVNSNGLTVSANSVITTPSVAYLDESMTLQQVRFYALAEDPAASITITAGQANGMYITGQFGADFLLVFNTAYTASGTITLHGNTTGQFSAMTTDATIEAMVNGLAGVAARGSYSVKRTGGGGILNLHFLFSPKSTFVGGNYVLTALGDTTGNIAWDSNGAVVQSALNALPNIAALGNIAVLETGNESFSLTNATYQTITMNGVAVNNRGIGFRVQLPARPLISGNAHALTPAPGSIVVTGINGGTSTQSIVLAGGASFERVLQIPQHGFEIGDVVLFRTADAIYDSAGWSRTGDDEITVNSAIAPYNIVGPFTHVAKRTLSGYTPGAKRVPCTLKSTFYLPGITPGVTVASDIPLPEEQSGDEALLLAALSDEGVITYDVSDLVRWLGGPIYQLTVTEIQTAAL